MSSEVTRFRIRRSEAETAIESLRKGIPPTGWVRHFTVGRQSELRALEGSLERGSDDRSGALLVRANYGAGKSHLLNVVREEALRSGYAVSYATLDALNGVRFNRMDQIFGAAARNIQVPDCDGVGVARLFDAYVLADEKKLDPKVLRLRSQISDDGKWDYSETLHAPALFVSLRAWVKSARQDTKQLVANYLAQPNDYRDTPSTLYTGLVNFSGKQFFDIRPEKSFYEDGVFIFFAQNYTQSWAGLGDLDTIARACGFRGLVLIFDEFEDVITNLNNKTYQQKAFHNLFRFFSGSSFPGMTYFAVTPDFSEKCKAELNSRGVYGFPFARFDELPHFELSRIGKSDFVSLAKRIRAMHGIAYDWDALHALDDGALQLLVDSLYGVSSADQTRQAIKGVVDVLDERLDD